MLSAVKQLSKLLNDAFNPKSVVSSLENFLIEKFGISDVSIFVLDESTKALRDFAKTWQIVEDKKTQINDVWSQLNEYLEPVIWDNVLYYPLVKYRKVIGLLRVTDGDIQQVIEFLEICDCMISLKVQNSILTERMQKNVEFHSSMKNIAKIIETQYEMNYIIPIIGEMIDKFVSEHLVYIFLADEENNNMQLIWPNACNDDKILEMVKIVDVNSEYFTTVNKKIGIFPMTAEGKLIGTIVTKSVDIELHEKEVECIEQLANQAATTINRANVYAEILKHATLDALTNFYNRRQLQERLKQEVSSAKRQEKPLCAIMCDIDFFKSVNDTYGHAAGDYVLKVVSRVIKRHLRDYDIAGRYGGEEFVILLPFTDIDAAEMVANRLRAAVEAEKINIGKINPEVSQQSINVTISLGVRKLSENDTPDTLIQNADKALYKAKEEGRNRAVVCYD